ncbi:hypothetical protein SAMN06297387_106188 [Streptomyces zhaozhouensis]|uniref:Uncharacterized protein n=1 Tax=Streptomyces zhaozhouensis TaxID=1300267 RepID=A0A286DVB2_9ACTN|nr:hypothetical protein [Streptomyces zhaozhouensis]SOD62611.1 hypothetical protein SAMN06297387_106188 [Streptomyces zhaozhouensis]
MTATRLDELIPEWDVRDRHTQPVRAPRAEVLRTARELQFKDLPMMHLLMRVGTLGTKRGQGKRPFLDSMVAGGFSWLHRDDDELIVGAAVRTGGSDKGPSPLGDDPFTGFQRLTEPGHYKVAFNFRVDDGELSTETRVISTDDATRRKFARYWKVIRLPSGVIRIEWLQSIRKESERRAAAGPQGPAAEQPPTARDDQTTRTPGEQSA